MLPSERPVVRIAHYRYSNEHTLSFGCRASRAGAERGHAIGIIVRYMDMRTSNDLYTGPISDQGITSRGSSGLLLWGALVIIVAVGAGLRLYRLSEQSIWHDEFLVVCHFEAPDLETHLSLMELYMPANIKAPLYFILQYYFARHFSDSLLALRLLAVFFGVLSLPMLFVLVRRLFGNCAALVAALCLALSPQHVWYSQEPRTYALSVLLTFIAFYATFRAAEENSRRWWGLSLAVNAVLPWTHLLWALAIATQGCFLLWHWRRALRRFALWASLQGMTLAPLVWRLFPLPFAQDGQGSIGLRDYLAGLFGVDVIRYYPELLPPWKSNPPRDLPGWLNTLRAVQNPLDAAMVSLFVAALLTLIIALVLKARKTESAPSLRVSALVYALFLWLIPLSTLAVMNMLTQKPFCSFMYAMYGLAGAYAAVGVLVDHLKPRILRQALVGLIVGLFAYQLLLFLPLTTRTNWRLLADHVRSHSERGDVIFNLEFYGPNNPLEYYKDYIGLPVRRLNTFQALCDQAADLFTSHMEDASGSGPPKSIWVSYRALFYDWLASDTSPMAILTAGLSRRGLGLERLVFPGQYNVTLLRIRPIPGQHPRRVEETVPAAAFFNGQKLLDDLELNTAPTEWRLQAERDLRTVVAVWPCWIPFQSAGYAVDLLCLGRPDLAEALSRHDIRAYTDCGFGHFTLGLALLEQGRDEKALSSFERAFEIQASLGTLTSELVHLLIARKDLTAARRELERMKSMGWAFYLPGFDYILRDRAAAGPVSQ